ncbi:hypothetical protein B6N60_01101 [Richelia sinica FACHB-800]|uniref:Uncharacterized protein n=1 Tax=Richelia sinica FACHB-800 TaxID=1357546 RepID=A0A975T6N3_9NOST|nr:hypothetical protein [Richelia sinica]MBD2664345.1 hypothetical protein [Richelia sinica FACHB-800]QXE22418.1 hypothetical protein B6N60_01101 [Richelia sinica FACHB-800]
MSKPKIFATPLNFHEDYPCPVCRIGKISHMPMMEAMSCDFCQEIFTVNLELQQIKMPSREPPLMWRWNGVKWTEAQLEGVELGWGYGLAAIAFVILPTALIGLGAYYFPPTPHAPLTWIPYIWTILTFLLHLSIIIWIFIEVYQIPISAYFRAITRWRNRATR